MPRKVVLQSSLPPSAAADTLRRSIDQEHRTLFSLKKVSFQEALSGNVQSPALARLFLNTVQNAREAAAKGMARSAT